jgi:hypothetical protein
MRFLVIAPGVGAVLAAVGFVAFVLIQFSHSLDSIGVEDELPDFFATFVLTPTPSPPPGP